MSKVTIAARVANAKCIVSCKVSVGVMHKPKLAKLKRRGSNVLNDGQRIVSSFFSKTSRSKEQSSIGVSIFFCIHHTFGCLEPVLVLGF